MVRSYGTNRAEAVACTCTYPAAHVELMPFSATTLPRAACATHAAVRPITAPTAHPSVGLVVTLVACRASTGCMLRPDWRETAKVRLGYKSTTPLVGKVTLRRETTLRRESSDDPNSPSMRMDSPWVQMSAVAP